LLLYARLTGQQIRDDPMWQKAAARKPKHLDEMSDAEKAAFKKLLDVKFPPNAAIMAKAMTALTTDGHRLINRQDAKDTMF
jgi:hypothetical protein